MTIASTSLRQNVVDVPLEELLLAESSRFGSTVSSVSPGSAELGVAGTLEGGVDGRRVVVSSARSTSAARPPEHVAQDEDRALAGRQVLQCRDEREPDASRRNSA